MRFVVRVFLHFFQNHIQWIEKKTPHTAKVVSFVYVMHIKDMYLLIFRSFNVTLSVVFCHKCRILTGIRNCNDWLLHVCVCLCVWKIIVILFVLHLSIFCGLIEECMSCLKQDLNEKETDGPVVTFHVNSQRFAIHSCLHIFKKPWHKGTSTVAIATLCCGFVL